MISHRSRVGYVVAGLLLAILMASMDNTIVATAMGRIVADLGGLEHFVWVTSAYMIASVAGMPIFGKLSDMYGRKNFFIFGLALFILGSILCGLAQTMVQLSIYRGIQGLGGGALMPIAFTIIFDIFPPERRGKMSALFGAVFGISSVFGPLLGAYIADNLAWSWIFYINLPLGLVALGLILKNYHESLERATQKIDWGGATLLVSAILSLMFALQLGGKEFPWISPQIIGLFIVFLCMFLLFLRVETRVESPIVNLTLFKNRLFATSQGIGFFYGSVFVVATFFIPIYVQAVYGGSATNSGLILMPMMLGVVAGSQLGGRIVMFTSYRAIMIVSGILLIVGTGMLGTLTPDTPRWLLTSFMVVMGMGVGASFPLLSMTSIHGLDVRQRGAANSSIAFFRIIGMTLGMTVFGALQTHLLTKGFGKMEGQVSEATRGKELDPQVLLQPEVRENLPPALLERMVIVFADSISAIFQWALLPVVIAVILIFLMGQGRLLQPPSVSQSEKGREAID